MADTLDDSDKSLVPQPLKAYLVAFSHPGESPSLTHALLRELSELVQTQGLQVVGSQTAKIREYNPSTIIGSGKVREIIAEAEHLHAQVIVCDDVLSPAQQRNWEHGTSIAVIDRQEVILEIFAHRAQTREARLQVQLAQANYELPRLVRKWTHLGRQRGAAGGLGGRAGGEQQLELDSRVIRKRIQWLNEELATVRRQRKVQRSLRLRRPVPVVAIVGYTNAGKSSLLNRLTHAGVLVEDKLFATLDPTVRRLPLPGGQEVLLADTVGFVRKLPHLLIEAFKSTLEETSLADYILEVLDASDPELEAHHDTTTEVLSELQCGGKPSLLVLNKWDLADETRRAELKALYPEAIPVSVLTGEGLPGLLSQLSTRVKGLMPQRRYIIPHQRYDILAQIRRSCFIEREEFLDDGIHITARVPDTSPECWEEFCNPPHSVEI